MRSGRLERQQRLVVSARLVEVRQMRQKQSEIHDVSPRVVCDAASGKRADVPTSRSAWRQGATGFPSVSLKARGINNNCHCRACRLLVWLSCAQTRSVVLRRSPEPATRRGARASSVRKPEGLQGGASADERMPRPDGAHDRSARRRFATARTVLPAGGTAARGRGADVLPVRQRNCSKIDYCYCPRHWPHL